MRLFLAFVLAMLCWVPYSAQGREESSFVSLSASHYLNVDHPIESTPTSLDLSKWNVYAAQGLLQARWTTTQFHLKLSVQKLEPFIMSIPTFQAANDQESYRLQVYIKKDKSWQRLQELDDLQASYRISPEERELELLFVYRVGAIPILTKMAPVFLSEASYIRQKQPNAVFLGGAIGILLGMILFNLLGYLMHQQRHQLYYSVYSMSGTYWLAYQSGLIPAQTETLAGLNVFAGSGSLFLVLFTFASLTTAESYRSLYRLGLIAGGLSCSFQIITFMGIGEVIYGSYAVVPICGALSIVVSLRAALTQKGPAVSMLIGYIILFLSINFFILSYVFLQDLPDLNWVLMVGFCLETIMFSLAVGQKNKLIERSIMEKNHILQQKLFEEQAAGLNVQRLETNLRLQLAASIAHRVNNPLNAMQLSSDNLKLSFHALMKFVEALVGEEPSSDPEVRACQDQFHDLAKDFHQPLDLLTSGLSRARHSVQEIRALSGLDGGKNQLMPCQELWESLLAGFQEADRARLRNLQFLKNDFEIYGDVSLLRMSLEILLHVLARDPLPQDLMISAKAWDGHSWSCVLQVQPVWDLAMWMALERCMQGVLRASAMSCKVKQEHDVVVIDYFEKSDRA